MTLNGFFNLALSTVLRPREVAALLMSLNLSRDALWTAFSLVIVLDTLVVGVSQVVLPSDEPVSLGIYGAAIAASVAVLTAALTACSRAMQGEASFEQIAVLVIWLQAIMIVFQTVFVLLAAIGPQIEGLFLFGPPLLGVWLLVNFVAEANGFDSLWKSAFVLLLAFVGMVLAVSMIFNLAGVSTGGMGNV